MQNTVENIPLASEPKLQVTRTITLSQALVQSLDEMVTKHTTFSELVEKALLVFLKQRQRDMQNARDLEIINRHADRLNAETMDALDYQLEL